MEDFRRFHDVMLAEAFTAARWAQTSLLLINGGAAVAVLALEELHAMRIAAGGAFAIGVLLSIASAGLGTRPMVQSARQAAKQAGYWLAVAQEGVRHPEIEEEYLDFALEMERDMRAAKAANYGSALFFVLGCAITGGALVT